MAGQEDAQAALALETVGERLRAAREAAGLSRADIAARTKVAERHLGAIEDGRFEALASSTYAVGFARAYARAVGLEERAIAQAVREELAARDAGPARSLPDTFEPGDPARVPGVRIAWVATAAAFLVVALVLFVWRSYWFPAASLPDLTSEPAQAAQSVAPPVNATQPAAMPAGPVVFTAREGGVWVRFTDASGRQLLQKELALGESYTVPADAVGPALRTARPDALDVTVGGRPVARISERQELVRDVPVSAAALLARGAAPTVPVQSTAVIPLPSAAPAVAASQARATGGSQDRPVRPSPRPAATPSPAPEAPAPAAAPAPDAAAEPVSD